MDSLSPIIDNLGHPQLHYLKDSGIYEIADTSFVVFSVFDDPSTYIKANSFNAKTKIALFHGPVNNSTTDIGFRVSNDELKVSMFSGYDLALLGDIHKHQFLDKRKRVHYVGSLIQQNFGEAFSGHGYSVWNVKDRTHKFTEIQNDYGYYTIDVIDGIMPDIQDIPKYPRVRIRTENTTQAELKKVITNIKRACKTTDIVTIKKDNISNSSENRKANSLTKDTRDVNYQNKLIEDYLTRNFSIEPDVLKRIKNINRTLNQSLSGISVSRHVNWRPKRFEFENMFSYGKNNSINFEKTKGVVGLFAKNHMGKSALLDALSYCIFDKCSRTKFAGDVLNNQRSSFSCKFNFEIDGVDYYIERVGKKQKNGHVKVVVNFWMDGEGGEPVSLNGEQRVYTNQNIQGYLGTYDDFILTAMSVQNNNTGFIDKTQLEKKDLLAQFLDITVFEELYQLANEEIRDVQALLNDFRKTDYSQELIDAEDERKLAKSNYESEKSELQKVKTKISGVNQAIRKLSKSLNRIDDTLDIKSLNSRKEFVNGSIEEHNKKLQKYKEYTEQNKLEFHSLINDISLIDLKKAKQNKVEYDSAELELRGVKQNIELIKVSVKNKLDLISKLDTHKYDPNCKYCCDNEFVKSAYKAKEDIIQLKTDVKVLLDNKSKLESKMDKFSDFSGIDEHSKLEKRLLTIKQYQSEIKAKTANRNSEISSLKSDLRIINRDIKRYNKNEQAIDENKHINAQIEMQDKNKNSLDTELISIESVVAAAFSDIKLAENKIKSINDLIEKAHDLENKQKAYEYYLTALKRDGIPYDIITNVLPYIQDEVNNILSQIVEFSITFSVDGKNILANIVYDDINTWPLELTSGMEKFIASLAIRVALINVSNLPRPNFLAVDEGFGNLDTSNLSSMSTLLDYLKTEFDFIFIISHIDVMKDMADESIEITKQSGLSNVIY
jgi:DNA repair exonuclease SbcCD ATPase subunit